jgi:penicillin-binding protein 1A
MATVVFLGGLAAWIALQVDWEVPDPTALTGPTEILARDGTVLARFTAEVDRRPVPLGEDVARTVTQALEDAVARGTGSRAAIGRPQAGKTGTTQDVKDAWFVGYTPQLSMAVWVGDPGRDGQVEPLRGIAGYDEVYGGTIPAQVWADVATVLLAEEEPAAFPEPDELPGDGPEVDPHRSDPDPEPEQEPEQEAVEDDGTTAEEAEPLDDAEADEGGEDPEPEPEPAAEDPPNEPEPEDEDAGCLLILTC